MTDYDRFLQDLTGGEAKLGWEGWSTSGHGAKFCREGEVRAVPAEQGAGTGLGGAFWCGCRAQTVGIRHGPDLASRSLEF